MLLPHPQIQKQCADAHPGHILSLQSRHSPGLPGQNSLIIINARRECQEPGHWAQGQDVCEVTLNFFLSNELSGIYLDLCKDNLYCNAPISKGRRASQSVMALIGGRLFGLLAPILTYTINEALSHTQSLAL